MKAVHELTVSKALVATLVFILVLGSGALLFVFIQAGRGLPSGETNASGNNTKTPPETVVVGTIGQLGRSLDPAYAVEPLALNLIRNLGAGLVDYSPGGAGVVPALATSWTSSGSGTVWTFNLRQGVRFPDGAPFNSSVVVDSFTRASNINSGTFRGEGYNLLISNITAIGTYQVQFFLNHPASVDFATHVSLYPVDPKLGANGDIINYTGQPATENPNGLGPYSLGS
jgi:peptide/nickel transport system substrate-binding protein